MGPGGPGPGPPPGAPGARGGPGEGPGGRGPPRKGPGGPGGARGGPGRARGRPQKAREAIRDIFGVGVGTRPRPRPRESGLERTVNFFWGLWPFPDLGSPAWSGLLIFFGDFGRCRPLGYGHQRIVNFFSGFWTCTGNFGHVPGKSPIQNHCVSVPGPQCRPELFWGPWAHGAWALGPWAPEAVGRRPTLGPRALGPSDIMRPFCMSWLPL